MFKYFISKKGYSLLTWIFTVSVMIAVVMIVRIPLKDNLKMKIRQTTGYVLWTGWGANQTFSETETSTRELTNQSAQQSFAALETHDGNITTVVNNTANVKSVTASSEEGSQQAMDAMDLSTFQ